MNLISSPPWKSAWLCITQCSWLWKSQPSSKYKDILSPSANIETRTAYPVGDFLTFLVKLLEDTGRLSDNRGEGGGCSLNSICNYWLLFRLSA